MVWILSGDARPQACSLSRDTKLLSVWIWNTGVSRSPQHPGGTARESISWESADVDEKGPASSESQQRRLGRNSLKAERKPCDHKPWGESNSEKEASCNGCREGHEGTLHMATWGFGTLTGEKELKPHLVAWGETWRWRDCNQHRQLLGYALLRFLPKAWNGCEFCW